jgi:hypothetical protein
MKLPDGWTISDPLTLEEIEAANLYQDDGRVPHVPFGFGNDKWLAFKCQLQPGDQLHAFESSAESWKHLAGRAGFLIVRGDEIIAQFDTLMN